MMPARNTARKTHRVRSATKKGSRATLEAMRDLIADKLDEGVPPRDLASLTKRLMEVSREIDAFDATDNSDDPVALALNCDDEVFDEESSD